MTSYDDLVKLVTSIESGASVKTQSTVNITNVTAGNVNVRGAGYGQLLDQIERASFETPHKPKEEKEHIRLETTAAPTVKPAPAAAAAQVQAFAPPAYEAEHARLKEKAKQELAEVTGALKTGPTIEEAQMSINMKDLVLPNLPMAEQVPELEKIIEGIRGKIFDNDQLTVLTQELRGLQIEIAKERATIQKGNVELQGSEKEMWAVREQRLSEALALVK